MFFSEEIIMSLITTGKNDKVDSLHVPAINNYRVEAVGQHLFQL